VNQLSGTMDAIKIGKAMPDVPDWPQPTLADQGIVPKVCFRWILSGPSKSGKSNLARYALDHFYQERQDVSFFKRIILISPTGKIDPTWKDLKGLKDRDRITDCTPAFLERVLKEQMSKFGKDPHKNKKQEYLTLVIFDDPVCESKLIHSAQFLKTFVMGRHYGLCIMAMTQSYVLIPRSARIQATHVSMFPSKTSEIMRLYDEHGPRQLTKKQFVNMGQDATAPEEDDEYPFLYVNCFEKPKARFRRNFNEVLEIQDRKPRERSVREDRSVLKRKRADESLVTGKEDRGENTKKLKRV